ncbi:MAG: RNA methyltransferase [Clostridia bacterium]|nr:RNA methyltransferase [Clostridia bacterium]
MSNIIHITDFDDPRLDVYARLTEAQLLNREFPSEGLFIAESPKVIERALDAGYEPVSVLVETSCIKGESEQVLSRVGDIPVFTAPMEVLKNLTGYLLTRGLLCAMRRPMLKKVSDVIKNASRIVILEEVMNPTNVGAIFRSAAALGMDAVLLTPGSSNPLYRRSARVSMGTVFQIDWTILPSWDHETVEALRKEGFKTVAMALCDDSVSIDDKKLKEEEKLAIILGTEGDGLKNETIADCDYTVKIPMYHGVDSLNVAAASAVAFYELKKR